ncbi:MAG: hypothetical protein ACK4NP_08925 [Parvularculaceae bacterium]
MATDSRGRRSVTQFTVGLAAGSGENFAGRDTFGATMFSSVEYGIGIEKGFGAFGALYLGDPSNFEGPFSTTGGQGPGGIGGSVTVADGITGAQVNFGGTGGSSTVGFTKNLLTIGDAFQKTQEKVGATFSNQSVSFSNNENGSVTATTSTAGSRITREVTCDEDGCK